MINRILSTVLVFVMLATLFQLCAFADTEPVVIAYEDFDYGVESGTDISTIPAVNAADPERGFSDRYYRDQWAGSDILLSGRYEIVYDDTIGWVASALLNNPSKLYRAFQKPLTLNPENTTVYYIGWNQLLGEDGVLESPVTNIADANHPNKGQIIDFQVSGAKARETKGGGFIRTTEGKTLPFVNWAGLGGQFGKREVIQGKWYRMIMRIEANNSSFNDKISLKAFPKGEYPHTDWDASVEFNTDVDLSEFGFSTVTEWLTGITQKFGNFKVEKYVDTTSLVAAEKATEAAYDAVLAGDEAQNAKIAEAETAVSAIGDGLAKQMLEDEIAGIYEYKDLLNLFVQVKVQDSVEAFNQAQAIIDAMPDSLRKTDFQQMLESTGTYISAVQKIEQARELLTAEAIEEAEALVATLQDDEEINNLTERIKVIWQMKAEKDVTEIENTIISSSNVISTEAEIASAKELVLRVVTNEEQKQELLERLNVVNNNLNAYRIEAFRMKVSFDDEPGTLLSSKGWMANDELSQALDNTYLIEENGVFSKQGNIDMYRLLARPIDTETGTEYYLTFDFGVDSLDGFAGLLLGQNYFGVESVNGGLIPVVNFGAEAKGTELLEAADKYTAVLRIASGKVYMMVYPYGDSPKSEWGIQADIVGAPYVIEETFIDELSSEAMSRRSTPFSSNVRFVLRNDTQIGPVYGDYTTACLVSSTGGANGSFMYDINDITSVVVQNYKSTDVDSYDIKYYYAASKDGPWTEITPDIVLKNSGYTGWNGYEHTLTGFPNDANYLKIEIPNHEAQGNNQIQLGRITLNSVKSMNSSSLYTNILGVKAGMSANSSFRLYGISKEEVAPSYLQQLRNAVEIMRKEEIFANIDSALTLANNLSACIPKSILLNEIENCLAENKEIVPTIDYVAIDGNGAIGSTLKAKVTIADLGGNAGDTILKWYVGSSLISEGDSIVVNSSYSGQRIALQATTFNRFGKEGETKSTTLKIPSSSGISGGGSGSGRVNNGSSVVTPVIPSDTTPSRVPSFEDIDGHWAKTEIEKMFALGHINGVDNNHFKPDDFVTRAQFAAMLCRLLNIENEQSITFTDVKTDAWYASSVGGIASAGIMIGNGDGKFRPDSLITREELAKAVILAYNTKEKSEINVNTNIEFKDKDEISPWALEYIQKCNSMGLLQGVENNYFAPDSYATRAQATVVLSRLLQLF